MKKHSGNPNLPTKTGNYLPNIEQTKQVIQQANVNHKALSNILNSRDPEFWMGKVREALDKEAWTEATYYGLKALFYDENFIKADIVLAYAFGRLRNIYKSLFYYMEKVDRFDEVEAEVYRSLLSREELYFLSVFYGIFNTNSNYHYKYKFYAEKLEKIAKPIKLDLRNKKLSNEQLVKIILENPDVHYLNLTGNKLTSLPKEIGQLVNLTSLSLDDNQLINLPKEIGQLTNLTSLNLGSNQLTSLPKEIGQLTNLTFLDLKNNRNLNINDTFLILKNLPKLTFLDLKNNQLTSLPKEIGQLTNLTSLNLRFNQLTSLPKEIGQLTNLTRLNLSDNNFSRNERVRITNLLPNCTVFVRTL